MTEELLIQKKTEELINYYTEQWEPQDWFENLADILPYYEPIERLEDSEEIEKVANELAACCRKHNVPINQIENHTTA